MLQDILNYRPLTDRLLSSGMPTADQVRAIAEAGVELVINLAPFDPGHDLHDEAGLVASAGMDYLNIPVDWEAPKQGDLQAFMEAMDRNSGRKVLVHCRANYRATGFIALYRMLRLGWTREDAFRDVQSVWDPAEYPVWQKFIDESLSTRSNRQS